MKGTNKNICHLCGQPIGPDQYTLPKLLPKLEAVSERDVAVVRKGRARTYYEDEYIPEGWCYIEPCRDGPPVVVHEGCWKVAVDLFRVIYPIQPCPPTA